MREFLALIFSCPNCNIREDFEACNFGKKNIVLHMGSYGSSVTVVVTKAKRVTLLQLELHVLLNKFVAVVATK